MCLVATIKSRSARAGACEECRGLLPLFLSGIRAHRVVLDTTDLEM